MRPKENLSLHSRAAPEKSLRRLSSDNKLRAAKAISSSLPASTKNPVLPESTASLTPLALNATTGSPPRLGLQHHQSLGLGERSEKKEPGRGHIVLESFSRHKTEESDNSAQP